MLLTAPNLLTISRVLLVPLLVALFYVPSDWARWAALAVFTTAAITDYIDGWLARSMGQLSAFGRWLDPIADKLLVAATVVMLVGFERSPLIPAVIIVLREILVSGLREYLAEVSVGLPVSRLAKWKTAVQMVAIGILIVGDAGPPALMLTEIGWGLMWIAALLTLVTGWDYLQAGMRHMIDTDQETVTMNAAKRPDAGAKARIEPKSEPASSTQ